MENYIVSARKYRPSTFKSVVGQHALTTTLKNAIATGKLAHAYLFCGPRGVGKTTCARIFAKTINCMHPTPDGEACNACESCVAFNEQRSLNIHELDAASNNSVDDIRQLVEQVRIPPQIGHYKVYIIDEVHMLSASAFNAFLKTLEEPPHHAIFILATTEKHKILPTIQSRCQIYDFSRITTDDIVSHLAYVAGQEGIKAEPEALNVIALKADGGMRDALSIFDQVVSFTRGQVTYQSTIENLNVLDYEYYFKLTDHLLNHQVSESLLLFNDVLNKGFDGNHFVTGLATHFRDLLVSKDEVTLPLLEVGASLRERYKQQAQQCPVAFLYAAMKLCNDCDLSYRTSKNKRLLVEITLIQLAQIGLNPDGGHTPPQGNSRPSTGTPLKPVFNTATSAPQARPQTQASPTSQPNAEKATAPQPSATPAQPGRPATPATTASLIAQQQESKKIHVVKKSGLGISIKQTPVAPPPQGDTPPAPTPEAKAQPAENHDIDEHGVNYFWQEYVGRMPQEQIALAKRMKNISVKLLDPQTCEIVVDNQLVANDLQKLLPTIETHLRTRLKHQGISLHIRISEPSERPQIYSRNEKFQALAQKNKALLDLQEQFGLEFI